MPEQQKTQGSSLLIGYLYLIQGLVLSLPATIILTYSKLPEYSVLSLFSAAWLPFSFKFISAPFIQTYSSLHYGRRKTWIVISCIITSAILLLLSYYTHEDHTYTMAVGLFFAVFFVSLEDISTDALAVKQLKNPQRASFLQASMQQVGTIIGSLVFMKLISKDFATSIGLSEPIATVPQYFRLVVMAILIPTFWIHLKYRQQILEQQKKMHHSSLSTIFLKYGVFFNIKNKLCRQALMFLIYLQGISFFASSYEVQLMRGGFSKQTLTLINNLVMGPVLLSTFIFSHRLGNQGQKLKLGYVILLLRLLGQVVGYVWSPDSNITVTLFLTSMSVLMIGNYVLDCNAINSFPPGALSGMYITMLNSSRNLGTSHTLQLRLIGYLGYNVGCYMGFVYTGIVCLFYMRMRRWVEEGSPQGMESVPEQIKQN